MIKKIFAIITLSLISIQTIFSQEIWDDFEQKRIGYYNFIHGVMTINTANPSPNSVNSSDFCAKYERNIAETYDVLEIIANGPMFDVSDYISGAKKMKIDVYSPAVGIPIQITLEDSTTATPTNYPTGRHSEYIGVTTVANQWETVELVFNGQPDPSLSNVGITSIILLFNPATNTDDTYYFDNLMGPEVNGPCNGFISNPQSDLQDWDCNWNINFGYMSGQLLQSYNPAVGSVNTSKYSAKYTRVPDSNGEDVLIANFSAGSLDLSSNNIFRIQLYGPPRPFKISFQDDTTEVISFYRTISSANQWQQFPFDLSSVSGQNINRFVLFLDQGVVNFDVYYIDNIGLSSSPSSTIELNDQFVTIFPNPVDDKLFIKSSINNSEFDFFIYDSKGLLVKKGRIYNPSSINNIRLELPSGIYSMMIRSKNNILTKKISVK